MMTIVEMDNSGVVHMLNNDRIHGNMNILLFIYIVMLRFLLKILFGGQTA